MNTGFKVGTVVSAAVLAFFVLFWLCTGFTVVQGGYVGVHIRFGHVKNEELTQGFYFLVPWADKVVHVETRMRSFEVSTEASSKDLQAITTKVSLQHNLSPEMAAETYVAIGDLTAVDNNVISQAVSEVLKSVTAQYTAEELITKRGEVKQKITDGIQTYVSTTFENRGLEAAVRIDNVAVTDFDFSPEFNISIEAKVKAEQEALKAENEKKKTVIEAQAAAEVLQLKADSQAYQIKCESVERANAIKREAEALAQNPLLIQLRAVEKWSGTVPTYFGGNMPVPFLQVK